MVREGASLKEVADVLGHRSLDTTTRHKPLINASIFELAARWISSAKNLSTAGRFRRAASAARRPYACVKLPLSSEPVRAIASPAWTKSAPSRAYHNMRSTPGPCPGTTGDERKSCPQNEQT